MLKTQRFLCLFLAALLFVGIFTAVPAAAYIGTDCYIDFIGFDGSEDCTVYRYTGEASSLVISKYMLNHYRVIRIASNAFNNCDTLKKVFILGDLGEIESKAFYNCKNLKKIVVPPTVNKIGNKAFGYTSKGKIKGFTIYGYKNSRAQKYAKKNGFKFADYTKHAAAIPKNIKVSLSKRGFKIKWKSVKNCKKYSLYKRTGGSGSEYYVESSTSKNYIIDNNISSKQTYYYTVRAAGIYPEATVYNNEGIKASRVFHIKLKNVEKVKKGVIFKWNKSLLTKYYRVFRKTGSSSWKKLADTKRTIYTDKKAGLHKKYKYAVRCLSDNRKSFTTAFPKKSTTIICVKTPKLKSVKNIAGGVKISWKKVKKASKYAVFRKTKKSKTWKKIASTKSLKYVDKKVKSGKKYYYALRCLTGKSVYSSDYCKKKKSVKYIASPRIRRFSNLLKGTKFSWSKVKSAGGYWVFVKSGSKWKLLGKTSKTSFYAKRLRSGKRYSYTVRAVNKKGKFIASYYKSGKSYTFLSAPALPKLKDTKSGVRISWKKVRGAAKYRVYRKTAKGKWRKIKTTKSLSYKDNTVEKKKTYYYTIRCVAKKSGIQSSYRKKGKKITVKKMKVPKSKSNYNKLVKYIKNHGVHTLEGNKISYDNTDEGYVVSVFLNSDGKLKFSCNQYGGYGNIYTAVRGINLKKSNLAYYDVSVNYSFSGTVVSTSSTINLKQYNNSSVSDYAVGIGYINYNSEYYTYSQAKHSVYSSLRNCFNNVDSFLKKETKLSLHDIGFRFIS